MLAYSAPTTERAAFLKLWYTWERKFKRRVCFTVVSLWRKLQQEERRVKIYSREHEAIFPFYSFYYLWLSLTVNTRSWWPCKETLWPKGYKNPRGQNNRSFYLRKKMEIILSAGRDMQWFSNSRVHEKLIRNLFNLFWQVILNQLVWTEACRSAL